MLGSYQRSFLAILLAQFTRKRITGGMSGVVRLAERSAPVQARPLPLPGFVLQPERQEEAGCMHMHEEQLCSMAPCRGVRSISSAACLEASHAVCCGGQNHLACMKS
jgi:hypothetical protein